MEINNNTTVADIVANNYKTATIFKLYGIDFCCNGNRTIQEVSTKKNIVPDTLINKLIRIDKGSKSTNDYQNWSLDFLCDYVYQNHHTYVEKQIPEILEYLTKIAKVHGNNHPELHEVLLLFKESAGELTTHMKKEELILFPFIKKLVTASNSNTTFTPPPFGTVENPINMMHTEHDNEGNRFRTIAELTNNYTPPEDACNTYKVALAMLQEFEEDLHKHIHLENNILFKKAIKLENKLNN
ncbi:iron-sulfur cluster repair di-iron protein [Tenacibaculum discolor]|uniref:iron-sulfur cluster repair di-iron protein n=1 Tax=Tenacibaculum discolor TaxID=361581 RepID=UPI000EADD4D6|nr:iron-sulfur cluster repair di-iron protein [Tenacibaculum discolor]RLJ96426.1 regulator of cell morphogenesis and NO signaling [Tenacibaculum discolor]